MARSLSWQKVSINIFEEFKGKREIEIGGGGKVSWRKREREEGREKGE
jgi:hypothetical protein